MHDMTDLQFSRAQWLGGVLAPKCIHLDVDLVQVSADVGGGSVRHVRVAIKDFDVGTSPQIGENSSWAAGTGGRLRSSPSYRHHHRSSRSFLTATAENDVCGVL